MQSVKKRFGSANSSPKKYDAPSPRLALSPTFVGELLEGLSPELIPIVTLLSSQSHRRYQEGIFMLYYDLNGDGKPADREWREVYGILTGNQLAYWDAANLAQFRNNPEALLETSSKPNYINFTDSVYNAMKSLPAAKQNLDNVVIVSTTLKNRYILQFKSYADLTSWYSALRLANFEYSSLQEAYTGALLSARGSRLSDIRTVLAEKRFDHEDWVSIRYGSGMAWKRCFAVVEPSNDKRKGFVPGRILLYENDQKKKKHLMAVVTNASSVTAIYPQAHQLIDHSTMLKMEAFINFKSPSLSTKVSKKAVDDFKNTSIFLMPEQHSSVPGFDTLIRLLIPLLDSFGLYGRPKRLKADRIDPKSLLFGLPTLPFVHYLEVSDITQLVTSLHDFLTWDVNVWTSNIKGILKSKLDRGYEGCGSQRGVVGAISSLSNPASRNATPRATPVKENFDIPNSTPNLFRQNAQATQIRDAPSLPPQERLYSYSSQDSSRGITKNIHDLSINVPPANPAVPVILTNGNLAPDASAQKSNKENHKSVQLADIYQKYSDIKTPSDQFHTDRNQLLNGSHEKFFEDELPSNVRQFDMDHNVYPKDDEDLFSDPDAVSESDDEDKIDVHRIGMLESTSSSGFQKLPVPTYDDRNSSYSSVASPMTQYHEFNEQFSKSVDQSGSHPLYQAKPINPSNFNGFSDSEDDSDIAPPVPTHGLNIKKSRPKYDLTDTKPNPGYPQEPAEEAPYPSLPPLTHKPKYITSPNSSQNAIPRFGSPEKKRVISKKQTIPPLSGFQQPQKSGLPQKLPQHHQPPPQSHKPPPPHYPQAPSGYPQGPSQQQYSQGQVPSQLRQQVPPQQRQQVPPQQRQQAPPQQMQQVPPQQRQYGVSPHQGQLPPQQRHAPPQQGQIPPQQRQGPPPQAQGQAPAPQHRRAPPQTQGPPPQQFPNQPQYRPQQLPQAPMNQPPRQQYSQAPPPQQYPNQGGQSAQRPGAPRTSSQLGAHPSAVRGYPNQQGQQQYQYQPQQQAPPPQGQQGTQYPPTNPYQDGSTRRY